MRVYISIRILFDMHDKKCHYMMENSIIDFKIFVNLLIGNQIAWEMLCDLKMHTRRVIYGCQSKSAHKSKGCGYLRVLFFFFFAKQQKQKHLFYIAQ